MDEHEATGGGSPALILSGVAAALRGKTRRKPTGGGAMAAQSMLLGALLLGVGVLLDIVNPF